MVRSLFRMGYLGTGLLLLASCLNGCGEREDKPHKSQLIKAALTANYDGKNGYSEKEWKELCDGLGISEDSPVFYKEYGLPKASRDAYQNYLNENNN
ncbi:MAG: hypothetical protein ABIH37_05920 [archaeon]